MIETLCLFIIFLIFFVNQIFFVAISRFQIRLILFKLSLLFYV